MLAPAAVFAARRFAGARRLPMMSSRGAGAPAAGGRSSGAAARAAAAPFKAVRTNSVRAAVRSAGAGTVVVVMPPHLGATV